LTGGCDEIFAAVSGQALLDRETLLPHNTNNIF